MRPKARNWERDMDVNVTTPSDYTCMVKGLGKTFKTEEVKEFF